MAKKQRKAKQLTALFCCLLLILSLVAFCATSAGASVINKKARSYDIAVVFDNSGSMYFEGYTDGNDQIFYDPMDRWCQAKYAMEIFASMLDFTTDKLTIFPMWEVTTDGSEIDLPYDAFPYVESVSINSIQDISKITNMYTQRYNAGTPFAPVQEAADYLRTSSATDKWIIVMTDGVFNQITRRDGNGDIAADDLKKMLLELSGDGINMQYLGFGEATQLTAEPTDSFYVADKNQSLQEKLISSCNMIFKRSELPSSYLSGTSLTADISMRKLIVFAQGADAKITSLLAADGTKIDLLSNSNQRTYSTVTGNGYILGEQAAVDTSLAGQVVTFDAFPAGSYTLEYTNADKIQLFYEPDVDMKVAIGGLPEGVDMSAEDIILPAGDYSINAILTDSNTGEDLTEHPLLGNVDLKINVTPSSTGAVTEYKNGKAIAFGPDESTDIEIVGTYLDDYTITSKDDINLDFLSRFRFVDTNVKFEVKADCLQKDDWYVIKEHDQWAPVKATLMVDGQPLTEEQWNRTKVSLACSDPNLPYRVEVADKEASYYIYIGQTEDGTYVEPPVGSYNFSFAGTQYIGEFGELHVEENAKAKFDIQTYSKIWVKLIWVVIIGGILLLLALIFLLIMLKKVLPKRIEIDSDTIELWTRSSRKLDGKSFMKFKYAKRTLTFNTCDLNNDENRSVTFTIAPVDNRFTKSASRGIRIVGIESSTTFDKISAGAADFYRHPSGAWSTDPNEILPIDEEIGNADFRFIGFDMNKKRVVDLQCTIIRK